MARILIVDDDSQLLRLLDMVFKKSGYEVVTATDGSVALAILKKQSFDVVVTDVIMPEADGLEVIAALAEMSDRPVVIAMSGGSQRIDSNLMLATAKAMKADLILSKPIMPRQLVDAVDALLAKAKAP